MKKHYLFHIAVFVCSVLMNSLAISQTSTTDTLTFGGIKRTYRIYVPAIYNSSKAVPLVFNLHGLGSNADQQEAYGDFRPIADTANFIIVCANGTTSAAGQGWNNFGALGTGVDDIGFISALIDRVSGKYSINKNRIYSTGMSNGGFMSYDLACFLNTRIAAIASVTGSMIASHLKACKANRPTPIMEIHGTADNTVTYAGNGGLLTSTHIDTLVNFWAKFNNCSAPVITALPNTNTSDGSTVEHRVYKNGKNGSSVELYKVINGGHTWPGSKIPLASTNQDFNASKEIWRFFNQFSLDKILSVDQVPKDQGSVELYPNPATDGFEIRTSEKTSYTIRLFNNVGQQLTETQSDNGTATISRGNLATGVYHIQICSPDFNVYKKVVFN
jgi:polyhydroxybutyrate depolymerase